MINITNGITRQFRKMIYLWGGLLFIMQLLMAGCSLWGKKQQDGFSHLKGQHILVVINGLNRNPDVIEDWVDYKRYTWRQCKATGEYTVGIRNDDAYYLQPEVVCCDVQFDTDRKNIILDYAGLTVCPVNDSLKK